MNRGEVLRKAREPLSIAVMGALLLGSVIGYRLSSEGNSSKTATPEQIKEIYKPIAAETGSEILGLVIDAAEQKPVHFINRNTVQIIIKGVDSDGLHTAVALMHTNKNGDADPTTTFRIDENVLNGKKRRTYNVFHNREISGGKGWTAMKGEEVLGNSKEGFRLTSNELTEDQNRNLAKEIKDFAYKMGDLNLEAPAEVTQPPSF